MLKTSQEKYLTMFKEITDEMYEITKAKNSDYSGLEDAFKNFTMVEAMGIASTEQGFLTRMMDKMMRVSNFVNTGELKVVDEKVEDTLIDLSIYTLIFLCYLKTRDNKEISDSDFIPIDHGADSSAGMKE